MDKRETELRLKIALAIAPEMKTQYERELDAYLTGAEPPTPGPVGQPVNKVSRLWWAGGLAAVLGLGAWALQPTEAPWRTEYLQQRLEQVERERPPIVGVKPACRQYGLTDLRICD